MATEQKQAGDRRLIWLAIGLAAASLIVSVSVLIWGPVASPPPTQVAAPPARPLTPLTPPLPVSEPTTTEPVTQAPTTDPDPDDSPTPGRRVVLGQHPDIVLANWQPAGWPTTAGDRQPASQPEPARQTPAANPPPAEQSLEVEPAVDEREPPVYGGEIGEPVTDIVEVDDSDTGSETWFINRSGETGPAPELQPTQAPANPDQDAAQADSSGSTSGQDAVDPVKGPRPGSGHPSGQTPN